jgi:cytochrome c-type biogenesis protein CcmH
MMVIAEELRCLVCQNETIAASHADLAIDLKNQIRIKLTQGQSQRQILDFMVERYGDFVLYRPPLKTTTALLWLGPFALLGIAVLMLIVNVRRRRRAAQTAVMSDEDHVKARALLDNATHT